MLYSIHNDFAFCYNTSLFYSRYFFSPYENDSLLCFLEECSAPSLSEWSTGENEVAKEDSMVIPEDFIIDQLAKTSILGHKALRDELT